MDPNEQTPLPLQEGSQRKSGALLGSIPGMAVVSSLVYLIMSRVCFPARRVIIRQTRQLPAQPERTSQSMLSAILGPALVVGTALVFLIGYWFTQGYYSAYGIRVGVLSVPAAFYQLFALSSLPLTTCLPMFLFVLGMFLLLVAGANGIPIEKTVRMGFLGHVPGALLSRFLAFALYAIIASAIVTEVLRSGGQAPFFSGCNILLILLITYSLFLGKERLDLGNLAWKTLRTQAQLRPVVVLLFVVFAFVVLLVFVREIGEDWGGFEIGEWASNEYVLYSEKPLAIPDPTLVATNQPYVQLFKYDVSIKSCLAMASTTSTD